ncbi:hypothetical protein BIFANG_02279 [Bifidobacterium angulatum DSM 20098 = JCM 7096]|uniref:Uncharacterized protein n=1 Tax=Bifidobacterium angulatum DSM 20098 = JCM 7096 TaxID=518635 RepID=C4FD96_9BIFI|nr:hypothetical protein BIFANG_02279 [Bifidobacterium angulatum DSM 20098 = JCM 7096]
MNQTRSCTTTKPQPNRQLTRVGASVEPNCGYIDASFAVHGI